VSSLKHDAAALCYDPCAARDKGVHHVFFAYWRFACNAAGIEQSWTGKPHTRALSSMLEVPPKGFPAESAISTLY